MSEILTELEEDENFFFPFNSAVCLLGKSGSGKTVFATELLKNFRTCFRRAPRRIYKLVIIVTAEQKYYDDVEKALNAEHVVRTAQLTSEMGETAFWTRPGYDFDSDARETPLYGSVLWIDDCNSGNINGPALQVVRDALIHHCNLLLLAGVHDSNSTGKSEPEKMLRNQSDVYVIFFRGLTAQTRSTLQKKFYTADCGLIDEAVNLCLRNHHRYFIVDTLAGPKSLKTGILPRDVAGYLI
jgi:hypothetical protein